MRPSGKGPLKDSRVLVVEDEFFIADDLVRALNAAGAKAVGPVSSIEQADILLANGQVDAAILDLNLHGKMAHPLVERIARAGLPCLIVSGYSQEALPQSLRDLPRLEKPVNADNVLDSLERELRRSGG